MGAQRQPLFDDFKRTDATPSTHQESSFEFAGDYWEQPRALMQEWLDRIPSEQEYNDLRQRIRSRDDEQFRSAFLELYLHESLKRAETTLWRHPNPVHDLPAAVGLPTDTLSLDDSTLVEVSAPTRTDQFFGLPDPWPPGEAWPDDR